MSMRLRNRWLRCNGARKSIFALMGPTTRVPRVGRVPVQLPVAWQLLALVAFHVSVTG